MKIAIFTDCFHPQINGVVTATQMLASELSRKGHEIHILAPEFKEEYDDTVYPYTVKRFPAVPALFYEDFRLVLSPNPGILAYVVKHDFDLFHFQTPMVLGFQAIMLGKTLNKPIVGTFHTFFADPDYLKHAPLNNKFIERLGWFYSNLFFNRCDLITVPSRQTGVELRNHGCRPPIHFISNGIDLNQFDTSRSVQVRQELGFQPADAVCLFVGRLAHEKNLAALIQAFVKAAQRKPGLKLLIVGGGPQQEEYRSLADKLDTGKSIQFMGRIEHDTLVASGIFSACDFFLTLSRTENQPVTILEAQANNCIPVCLAEKGLRSMLEHRKTGFFLSSDDPDAVADELIGFIMEKDLHAAMRLHIRQSILAQSIDHIGVEWERLYADLVLRHRSGGYLRFMLAKLRLRLSGKRGTDSATIPESDQTRT